MKILFFTSDRDIRGLVEQLQGDICVVENQEECLEDLGSVEEDDKCLLFLDFDNDKKGMEKFNKSIHKNDWLIRVILSGEMSVKEFKKHQKGGTSAHGYINKPMTISVLRSVLRDLEVSFLFEENEDYYEEGKTLPELPIEPSMLQGLDSATDSVSVDDELDDQTDGEGFAATEFKMNTQVRKLVDLHSVKGDKPPYEGPLNDKIQAKFDQVFADEDDFEDDLLGDAPMGGAQDPGDMDLSLSPEQTQDSIALDLDADSGDDSIQLDEEEEIGADLDLSADDDGDEEIDLGGEDDNDDLNLDEDITFDDDDEIDLDQEVQLGGGVQASEDFSKDGSEHDELSFEDDDELGEGELSFDEPSEEDADSEESVATGGEEVPEETLRVLDELTENRELPSSQELSEFEEQTGDLEIPEEMLAQHASAEETPDEHLEDEGPGDFSLDSETVEGAPEENEDLNDQTSDIETASPEADPDEDNYMSDDDNLNDEELLEFEDEETLEEGELAFSTEDAKKGKDSSEDSDEGGLEFNLGESDDSSEDQLETAPASESQAGQGEEEDGFSLDGDDDDDFALETGAEVAASGSSEEDTGGDELDLGGDDEDFDLGEDAVLSASEDNEGTGDFTTSEEDAGGSPSPASVEAGPSEFEEDELEFEEDNEIEKTQAINLGDVSGEGASAQDLEDDLDEGLDDQLEASEDDGFDLGEDLLGDESAEDLDEDLNFGAESDGEEEASFEAEEETPDEDFGGDEEELEEETNPTIVMSNEMTQDLEDMVDKTQATNEFRPQSYDDEMTSDDFDEDTALLDGDDLDQDDFSLDPEEEEATASMEAPEEEPDEPVVETKKVAKRPSKDSEGELRITREEDRIPPTFNEGEAVRLQATIRQLREEREELLKEISSLKKDNKLVEQDNLGLKAELDEAKIEISILKKRHGNEVDEMKYRLRLSDEKKMFAEEKYRKLQKEFDRLQQKVRIDFNQIKQREKELESQLELVKMDSESQVYSRDKKILDLKRKIDQLEFNMENVVIKEQKSRDDKQKLEERLERIMKTLRGSIEVLEDDIELGKDSRRKRD